MSRSAEQPTMQTGYQDSSSSHCAGVCKIRLTATSPKIALFTAQPLTDRPGNFESHQIARRKLGEFKLQAPIPPAHRNVTGVSYELVCLGDNETGCPSSVITNHFPLHCISTCLPFADAQSAGRHVRHVRNSVLQYFDGCKCFATSFHDTLVIVGEWF